MTPVHFGGIRVICGLAGPRGLMGSRITQVTAEVVIFPTSGHARLTQLAVEALIDTSPPARLTQLAVEVIRENTPDDPAPPLTSRASFVG